MSCSDDSSEATDTAVVRGCDDAIAALGRTCNLCDTDVHETRWEGNGARMERRKAIVWSATPALTASVKTAARSATPDLTAS